MHRNHGHPCLTHAHATTVLRIQLKARFTAPFPLKRSILCKSLLWVWKFNQKSLVRIRRRRISANGLSLRLCGSAMPGCSRPRNQCNANLAAPNKMIWFLTVRWANQKTMDILYCIKPIHKVPTLFVMIINGLGKSVTIPLIPCSRIGNYSNPVPPCSKSSGAPRRRRSWDWRAVKASGEMRAIVEIPPWF